jgi:tetratricopeptide (TPR) repeat protein
MAGAGKTALAIEVAYQALQLNWFPGGAVFVDMRGYSSTDEDLKPETAAEKILYSLGKLDKGDAQTRLEVLQIWRAEMDALACRNFPLLIILDNVSRIDQILPLIALSSRHRVIVTSRHTLASLPARHVELGELSSSSSIGVIDQALRAARPEDSRVSDAQKDAMEVSSLCGGLPLALQIVAALLKLEPHRPLSSLIEELSESRAFLDGLEYEEPDVLGNPLEVRAAFSLSYRRLTIAEARAFRLLAVAPGPDFSLETAAALLDLSRIDTRKVIRKLMGAGLLYSQEAERWLMHDLIWLYASEKAAEAEHRMDSGDALQRVLEHFVDVLDDADRQLEWRQEERGEGRFSSEAEAWHWVESECQALISAASSAYRHHLDETVINIVMRLASYFRVNQHAEWRDIFDVALKAAERIDDPLLDVELLAATGQLYSAEHKWTEAISCFKKSLALISDLGGHPGEAGIRNSVASALSQSGNPREAIAYFKQALSLIRAESDERDERSEGMVLHNIASLLIDLGHPAEAIDYLKQDLGICIRLGDRRGEGTTLNSIGHAHYDLGDFKRAASCFRKCAAISEETHDLVLAGHAMGNLGNAYAALGEFSEALASYRKALDVNLGTGNIYGEAKTLLNLGSTYEDMRQIGRAVKSYEGAVVAFRGIGKIEEALDAEQRLRGLKMRSPFFRD